MVYSDNALSLIAEQKRKLVAEYGSLEAWHAANKDLLDNFQSIRQELADELLYAGKLQTPEEFFAVLDGINK